VSKLFLRRSVFVKRFNHEMTLREVPTERGEARTTRSDAADRTSIASPARMRDTNLRTDRIRGDGRPSQNALRFKILRPPNRREGRT
jgi:hypothetical protein